MTPLVSFVIATHNRPMLLARAISSVIAQGPDAEVVVVCDEGSQTTRDSAAKSLRESDIFLSYPGLMGPAESRNMGRNLARGRWICFLDDDDTVTQSYLSEVMPHLDQQKITYTNSIMVSDNKDLSFTNEKRRSLSDVPLASIEIDNFISVGTFFVPSELAKQVDFDPYLPSHEDWDYLLKLYGRSQFCYADVWGARYHRSVNPTRNKRGRGPRSADYLSTYRRHPAPLQSVKQLRSERLARMGINMKPGVL